MLRKNKRLLAAGSLLCVLLTQGFADPVRSAAEPDYPPLSVVNSDGKADGFSVELLRAAVAEIGMEVSFQNGAWSEIKTDLAEGRLDVLPLVGRTPERRAQFDFTIPYLTVPGALFVRDDNTEIRSLVDLQGRRIAVMQSDNAEEYVRRARLSENIMVTTNFDEAFRMLSDGRADAVIAQKLMGVSLLKQMGLANIRETGKPIEGFQQEFCFAVKKGNGKLLSALNKGLSAIMIKGTYRQLERKWLYSNEADSVHKRMLVYSDNFASPPHSFLDEAGQPTGFNVELLRAVARKTGLNISFQLAQWETVWDQVQKGAIDITSMQYPNPAKEAWVDFSIPHSTVYRAVFARRDSPPYKTPEDLKGRRISFPKLSAVLNTYALQQGLEPLTTTESFEAAMELLDKGQVDFALGSLSTGLYWIRQNERKNLYAVDPRLQKSEFCYAVRKGDAALLDLLNDGLTQLKQSGEYQQIYNQWLGVLDREPYWPQVKKILLIVGAVITLLTAVAALLIALLKQQVKKRTLEIKSANQALKESRQAALNLMEDAVLAKERLELTQFALDRAGNPAFWVNSTGRFVYVNEAACRTLGYDKEELLRLSVPDIDPNMPAERWPSHWQELQEKKSLQLEMHHKTKDGRLLPVEVHASYIRYGNREYICTSAHDITNRKESEKRLRFEQNLFLSFMESLPANVYFKDTNGRFVYVNQSTAIYRGMAKEALIGKTDFDLFPEALARKKFEDEQRVMQTGQPVQVEELSGTVWHQTTKTPRYDENGNLAGTLGISWDITKRIIAQQKLEESQQFLRTVIDSIPVRVFWKDRSSTYLGCNLPFAHDVGIASPEEVVGKTDFDLVTTNEQSEAFRADDRDVIESGAPKLDIEEPQTRSDGTLNWLKTSKIPLKNIQGEIIGVIGAYEDITESKRMQEALRESAELFRLFMHHSPVYTYIKEVTPTESRVLQASDNFHQMIGIPGSEMAGKTMAELFPAELALKIMADDWAVVSKGAVLRINEELNGRSYTTIKFPIVQGDRTLLAGYTTDITEEKKNKAELLRLSTAIEQSPETVMITGPGGIIQYVNPAFETITGYSREEALGKNPRILKSENHDAAFYSNLWKTITSGKTWEGRFVNKRKGGELYTEEAVISAVRDPSGTITGYVAVKRDITQELAQEEKFRQSQKMDAIGRLTGGIAHDFNNVLQAILGFSELLINQLKKDTLEHENALEVQKAARRAAEMTRQLLTFSRNQPADRKRIGLNTVVRDIEAMLQQLLGNKTALTFVTHPALHEIYIDPGQITQLIINLTVNARDAMPDGGHLTIATENITFAPQAITGMPEARPGSFVCLSATDTGCGMSREVKDHLFEPFFTTKAVGKGTGMGLSVVYGIVKQNKGWIHVDSKEGQGTTLKIYLPAYEAPATDNPTDRTRNDRILLVEDDAGMRNMFIQILESAGYKPVVAASAEEALELFKEQQGDFDLLFSDIVMPGKDGIELADLLRKESPGLPVVLCSGYQNQHDRWLLLESKGYHFLKKPVSVDGLLTAVYSALTEVIQ
ncbi:MAG: transporter substrate-binding domain-containing protein [Kiritimatiellales bacterium]